MASKPLVWVKVARSNPGDLEYRFGELVLAELPPNCSLDRSTSEVQAMLSGVVETLRDFAVQDLAMISDCGSRVALAQADVVDRARTLLGAPR